MFRKTEQRGAHIISKHTTKWLKPFIFVNICPIRCCLGYKSCCVFFGAHTNYCVRKNFLSNKTIRKRKGQIYPHMAHHIMHTVTIYISMHSWGASYRWLTILLSTILLLKFLNQFYMHEYILIYYGLLTAYDLGVWFKIIYNTSLSTTC